MYRGLLTAEPAGCAIRLIIDTNGTDGILVNGFELGIGGSLSLEVHLTEHVESGVFACASQACSRLFLNWSNKLPSTFVAAETVRFAVLYTRALIIHR